MMILVDSSILMYGGGAAHPYKAPSLAFLEKVATGEGPGLGPLSVNHVFRVSQTGSARSFSLRLPNVTSYVFDVIRQ